MDRRSWPWKKKSSKEATPQKVAAPETVVTSALPSGSRGNQDDSKKNTQTSLESHLHLTKMEDQIKTLNGEVEALNKKLSAAHLEISTRDNIVNQHIKVAEEAVSGWEKAKDGASALKDQLESVMFLKHMSEERATYLDGALKECTGQIQYLKEEHAHEVHEIVLAHTKQLDKIKLEVEAKLVQVDQELLRSSAENAALLRSLQEHSDMLKKVSEEKSQATGEIEHLKSNIQSREKEINSLNYELQIAFKELEIRNEEKNMSIKTAEVANKEHLESVKKINKLELECERLRGLLRKKLPGLAAMSQMKLEVETLNQYGGEVQSYQSPKKSVIPHSASASLREPSSKQRSKQTEYLMTRLSEMEEETDMLKEALAKRSCELQASRQMCAKTSTKLRIFEAQMRVLNRQKSSRKSNVEISLEEPFSHVASYPSSVTSKSADGTDDERNSDSWATASASKLSHSEERKFNKSTQLEIMDDFLQLETSSYLTESKEALLVSKCSVDSKNQKIEANVTTGELLVEKWPYLDSPQKLDSDTDEGMLSKLQSKIYMILKSKDANMDKILEDIKHVVQDIQDSLPHSSINSVFEHRHSSELLSSPDTMEILGNGTYLTLDDPNRSPPINQNLISAIFQIHDYVVSLGKEAITVDNESSGREAIRQRLEQFSGSVNLVLRSKLSMADFVVDLSHFLAEASKQLKSEKDTMAMDLTRCKENLELKTSELQETEKNLTEAKLQLEASQNSNILTDTQLKCMVESFKALELHTRELETEADRLGKKESMLVKEVQDEKRNHRDTLSKCNSSRTDSRGE